jgi:polyphosphate glucokinase
MEAAILGIDIGGSGIKGAPVNTQTGQMVAERFRLVTPEPSLPEAVAGVISEISRQFKWNGPIGAGFPSVVIRGVIMTAANIDQSWIGTDAAKLFSEKTGCPVTVINDADAAGLAEMRFGAGRNCQKGTVLMITLGTGIGSAIFTDGHLVRNTEFGHLEIRGKDAERRASDAAKQRKALTWPEYGGRVNEYLAQMERLFWPDLIIIGGGISKDHEKFFPYLTTRAKIVPAEMLNNAGIVGAAMAAENPD